MGLSLIHIWQYALVIGCEALSRLMDPTDRSTCVLFGDGAGAAIFRLADTPFALTLGARGSDVLHAGGPSREGSAPITMAVSYTHLDVVEDLLAE